MKAGVLFIVFISILLGFLWILGDKLFTSKSSVYNPSFPKSEKLFNLVNKWRIENKLNPLTKRDQLCNLSKKRLDQIIIDWSHNQFISEETKIKAPGATFGENLSRGYFTEKDTLDAWIASPEHLENLKNPIYTQECIVCEGSYCVQELSSTFTNQ